MTTTSATTQDPTSHPHPAVTGEQGPDAVNEVLTGKSRKRTRRERSNREYFAMFRRLLRAAGRRVVIEDPGEVRSLMDLRNDLDAIINTSVKALHDSEPDVWTWGEIAGQLGITRQAAHKRWANYTPPADLQAELDKAARVYQTGE